jgi:hypothetical protein
MAKESIFIQMEAIISEIGRKVKCKAQDNYLIVKVILNMKDNGEMITLKEKENFTITHKEMIGLNTKDNSDLETSKDLVNFFIKMETDTKVNSETIYFGDKVGYLIRMVK